MKKILFAILFSSLTAFAANKEVEPGFYEAVDADKGDINVQMQVNEDHSAAVSIVNKSPFKPDINCEGQWTVQESMFQSALDCDHFLVPYIEVNIDITNVNPESVRSEQGAQVLVQLDIMGPDPRLFILKKVEQVQSPMN